MFATHSPCLIHRVINTSISIHYIIIEWTIACLNVHITSTFCFLHSVLSLRKILPILAALRLGLADCSIMGVSTCCCSGAAASLCGVVCLHFRLSWSTAYQAKDDGFEFQEESNVL